MTADTPAKSGRINLQSNDGITIEVGTSAEALFRPASIAAANRLRSRRG